ncbi:hypothetical protein I317_02578 [Kwoniella heveanensis CBS 569]|nr:hypothetical protein I317_02578 [Kwoniella heveanensis CBS 569]
MLEATHEDLDNELELISSSLLPSETLDSSSSPSDQATWPRVMSITSSDSALSLHVTINQGYRSRQAVKIEVKGAVMGREEATGWQRWTDEKMTEYDESDDYPLYQVLTTHFLPLLAPSSTPSDMIPHQGQPDKSTSIEDKDSICSNSSRPLHALLISHHLLSSTKRKDLLSLSSSLSLTGFSKTGHPGIMYAIGERSDLEEWIREVKSWNWLALKVRITPEVIPDEEGREDPSTRSKGKENGARRGKGRGDWTELEKINEALDWLKNRNPGREKLLMDFGVGGGAR